MKKKKLNPIVKLILVELLLIPVFAKAGSKPIALVYDGPGACRPGCVNGASAIAKLAGYQVQFVEPGLTDYTIFDQAALWVQPGGTSATAAAAMGPAMIQKIRDFVTNGGGYVGFCAGGFLSTANIGESDSIGLGIVPGSSELLIKQGSDHAMLDVTLADGSTRWVYYAGGPFFKVTDDQLKAVNGEVTARYPDGSIAGVHAHYGKGKVAVTGFHPEADWAWELFEGKTDPDGSDRDIAVDMVNYVTAP